jgi:hypothetical protein
LVLLREQYLFGQIIVHVRVKGDLGVNWKFGKKTVRRIGEFEWETDTEELKYHIERGYVELLKIKDRG